MEAQELLRQRIELVRAVDKRDHEHKIWKRQIQFEMGTLLNKMMAAQQRAIELKKQLAEEKGK